MNAVHVYLFKHNINFKTTARKKTAPYYISKFELIRVNINSSCFKTMVNH